MKMDCESVIKLEEILFKSERMGAVAAVGQRERCA